MLSLQCINPAHGVRYTNRKGAGMMQTAQDYFRERQTARRRRGKCNECGNDTDGSARCTECKAKRRKVRTDWRSNLERLRATTPQPTRMTKTERENTNA